MINEGSGEAKVVKAFVKGEMVPKQAQSFIVAHGSAVVAPPLCSFWYIEAVPHHQQNTQFSGGCTPAFFLSGFWGCTPSATDNQSNGRNSLETKNHIPLCGIQSTGAMVFNPMFIFYSQPAPAPRRGAMRVRGARNRGLHPRLPSSTPPGRKDTAGVPARDIGSY
jgi:hypothetical protein